ncbi:unnamed protein product [Caenorhabditis sp. 36 PRJEB53466]|nr:unnamed protein product [Caenorhabditis sp. 36 PRJEB53466]
MEWSQLMNDVKKPIVELLDYESRCNLRTCSKSDCALVDSSKFTAGNITIEEVNSRMDNEKTIIRINIDTFTIWFIGKNEVTKVDRAWNGELMEWSERKGENRRDVARRHIQKYIEKFGILESKIIAIRYLTIAPSENWQLKCKVLELTEVFQNDRSWLNRIAPNNELREIVINRWDGPPLLIQPSILNVTDTLRLNLDCDITDEQLKQVRAVDLALTSPNITEGGAKRSFERFLKYGKENDEFHLRIQLPANFDFLKLLPKSVVFRRQAAQNPDLQHELKGKIIGGFSNVHGLQNVRLFACAVNFDHTHIMCHIPKKSTAPHELYPFANDYWR